MTNKQHEAEGILTRATIRPERTLLKWYPSPLAFLCPKRCWNSGIPKNPEICPVSYPKMKPPMETKTPMMNEWIVTRGIGELSYGPTYGCFSEWEVSPSEELAFLLAKGSCALNFVNLPMMMSRMPIVGDNSYIDRWAYVPQDMQVFINASKPLSPSFNPMERKKNISEHKTYCCRNPEACRGLLHSWYLSPQGQGPCIVPSSHLIVWNTHIVIENLFRMIRCRHIQKRCLATEISRSIIPAQWLYKSRGHPVSGQRIRRKVLRSIYQSNFYSNGPI